ncbi:hypothetical protein Nepgr_024454 [Nepenthes gracilis]|uniref:Man1/Src1-like C-terminal domain-containing protein n=1 Tax=Nepenthes gracilis TaxID=150966 RepID=A0AAD3T606_NEPGR|nr:hypothetical protein Nepgr_024454 [Nepenthes gracilis]
MSATPRKRSKSASTNLKYKSSNNPNTTSTVSSVKSLLMEPPSNILPSKIEFLELMAMITIAVLVAVGCHFLVAIYSRQPKPFCDSNVEYDDSLSDSCEPCPSNGQCHDGLLECIQGYKKYGKLCVEDGIVNEVAQKMFEWVENHLCQAYAQFLCDGTGTIWIPEDQLRNDLDTFWQMNSFGLDNITCLYAKDKVVDSIDGWLETRKNYEGIKELKCRDTVAENYKTTTCLVRQWIAKHSLLLIPVCSLLLGCVFLLLRIQRRWHLSKRTEQLYHQVCDVLEENALLSKNVNDREAWLVASRLRDHLLSPKERRDPLLWKKVEELVNEDSRMECYPKIVKGEPKVVWEWQVEGSLRKPKKGELRNLNSSAVDTNRRSHEEDRSLNISSEQTLM